MGRFNRRAQDGGAPGRRMSLPAGKRMAAVGAVALLGVAVHTGVPAAAAKFPGKSAGPDDVMRPAAPGRAAAPARQAVVPVLAGQSGQGASISPGGTRSSRQDVAQTSAFRQIILPDLLIVAPKGLTQAQVARLRKIAGVRSMITFDGAEITAGGRKVSVIGVNPATFRSWVPLATASDQAFWAALSRGEFVAAQGVGARLALRPGARYLLRGATSQVLTFGKAAKLGLSGVDLLVNEPASRKLGLVRQVAGLISAPGVTMATLTQKVSRVLGPSGRIEVLRGQQLPLASVAPGTRPTTSPALFKASAARYCPRLSWTVLAAIGQIESADGTNVGPCRVKS